MASNRIKTVVALAALTITGFGSTFAAEGKPLKVYILAGQSNMQGQAKVETFDYLGCAKTMALIGKAFAEAVLEMENK